MNQVKNQIVHLIQKSQTLSKKIKTEDTEKLEELQKNLKAAIALLSHV